MNREDIEKLLKETGVAEDKMKVVLDDILAENGKDIEAEKARTTAKDGELTKANGTIKDLQATVKKFDGVDIDKLKKDATDLQTKYDEDIKVEQKKTSDLKKTFALKETLRDQGALDPDYIVYKQGGIEKFAFDDEGKPIGIVDIIKPIQESSPALFKAKDDVSNEGKSGFSSGGSHGGGADPDLDKLSDDEYYKSLDEKKGK